MAIECQDPRSGASINCNQDLPQGATAIYQCRDHYISAFGDLENGRMTCLESGRWSRTANFDEFTCRLDCGKPMVDVLGKAPVVVFGESTTRESFPWHAAIFRSDGPGTEFQFYCGGSLVTPSNKGFLVITAAHCVTSSLRTHKTRPLGDFRVVLGSVSSNYRINEKTPGTQIFSVKAAKIHPSYDYNRVQNDIAIIKLNDTVRLSKYVSPVCFPSRDMANKQVVGTGVVAGFGVDETTQVSQKLNFARLPVIQNQVCNYALDKELTSVEFCAGHTTGSSVCSGDSGGGLVFLDESSNQRLFLQGIASNVDKRSLDEKQYCQNYNTFTRVSSFVDWVQDQLDQFYSDEVDASAEGNDLRRPVGSSPSNRPPSGQEDFIVTIYRDINDKSNYEEWRMNKCSAVPAKWNEGQFWLDVHGKCLQFYEGRVCSGKSLQLQPSPASTIFRWNFPDYHIRSVSSCQGMPPSSSQITSGSSRPIGGGSLKPIGGSGNANNGHGQQGNRPPSTISSQTEDGSDYQVVGLRMHNVYRLRHGVPQVVLSEALNVKAKAYADKLIKYENLISSNDGGENLFQIRGSSESSSAIVKQAVEMWYNTKENYNWMHPTATSFSQLVWKSTREIGIGVARSRGRVICVVKYSPPGNVFYGGADPYKFFKENVFAEQN